MKILADGNVASHRICPSNRWDASHFRKFILVYFDNVRCTTINLQGSRIDVSHFFLDKTEDEFILFIFILLLKYLNKLVLFVITAVGGVSCGGRKMYPHTSSMVQILCFVRSSVISDDILRTQK